MDKTKEAELREKYGDIVVAKLRGKEFVFQTPTATDYEEFQNSLAKHGPMSNLKTGPIFREYVLKSLVYPEAAGKPDVDALEAAFQQLPAVVPKIANELSALAGADAEVTTKKG